MKERAILFSGPMVRALLDGSKTQTRRVVKPQPTWGRHPGESYDCWVWRLAKATLGFVTENGGHTAAMVGHCPYGQPGEKLWVRETWAPNGPHPSDGALYRADFPEGPLSIKFKPSIHMPRWASRITLEITGVRVERLQDISDADSLAEGVDRTNTSIPGYAKERYHQLWESINGHGSWNANPWVWVVEFKRVLP